MTTDICSQSSRARREPAVGQPLTAESEGKLAHMYGCAMPGRGATCDCGAEPVPVAADPPGAEG